jgi:hypothetical protein
MASGLGLSLAALMLGSLPAPVVARLYSCEDARGRLMLRDVPCKRGEKSRDPVEKSRAAKPASTAAPATRTVQTITEAEVQALVDAMDAAMARRDFGAILAYVSSDAVFEVEYRLPQGLRFMRFNKDEYAVYLRDGAALVSGFDYRRENTQILLSPGSHYAEFIATLRETVRVQGKSLNGVTRSKSMVEMRDGRPQITLVRAVTAFDSPDADEDAAKNKARGKAGAN